MLREFTIQDHVRLAFGRPFVSDNNNIKDFKFDDGLPPPKPSELRATEVEARQKFAIEMANKVWHSVAEFNAEFTQDEKKKIIKATRTNDDLAILDRELMAWRYDVHANDPRIIGGLDMLVAANIITSQRKQQILGL